MNDYKIVEDIDNNRFIAIVDDKAIGEIDFHLTDEGKTIVVTHTGVRPEYEGKGIAGAMTKAMLQYVRNNGLRIVPVCRYTKVYIDIHPGYKDLLQIS